MHIVLLAAGNWLKLLGSEADGQSVHHFWLFIKWFAPFFLLKAVCSIEQWTEKTFAQFLGFLL